MGITVPLQRTVAQKYYNLLNFQDFKKLLESNIHEYRFTCLEMLVFKYENSSEYDKQEIFKFYFKNKIYINNWDLVDTSAPYIVGEYLFKKDKSLLYKLASSKSIWDKRIAVLATFYFTKENKFEDSLRLAKVLLYDK